MNIPIGLDEQQANLKRWIAALRSGKYEQGEDQLRSVNDFYCVLGVGCDVFSPEKWVKEDYAWRYDNMSRTQMPASVRDAFGISCDFMIGLMRMNDDEEASFTEIADYMEDRLLGVRS